MCRADGGGVGDTPAVSRDGSGRFEEKLTGSVRKRNLLFLSVSVFPIASVAAAASDGRAAVSREAKVIAELCKSEELTLSHNSLFKEKRFFSSNNGLSLKHTACASPGQWLLSHRGIWT